MLNLMHSFSKIVNKVPYYIWVILSILIGLIHVFWIFAVFIGVWCLVILTEIINFIILIKKLYKQEQEYRSKKK